MLASSGRRCWEDWISTTIFHQEDPAGGFFGTAEPNHGGPGVCVGATNVSAAVCLRQRVKLNSPRSCCTKFLLPFNTSHFVLFSRLLIFLKMKRSRLKLSVALPTTLHALVSRGVTDLRSPTLGLCFAATSTSYSSFLASFHENRRNKGLKNKEELREKERKKKKKMQKLHKSPPSKCNSTPWPLLGTPLRRRSEQFAEMIYCDDLSASGSK